VIVDTSAVVAIVLDEPEAPLYRRLIRSAPVVRLSAASFVELSVVVDRLGNPALSGALDSLLSASHIRIEPFTAAQARIARAAYQRFGRGSGHPARLNMGDCFSYALAHELREPLLFKGRDFALTDIEIVTEPIRERRLSEVIAAYSASVAATPGG
jgi:ribonuclease VapC